MSATTRPVADPQGYRRALVLMTLTSFLVPAAGVVTAPILARALSTEGRGELAAALAPAALSLSAATLGLPDALTYLLARHGSRTRPALAWSSLITVGLGIVCLGVTVAALPFLRAGDHGLGSLIVLASAVTVPALVVNVFRGAATGRQMWWTVSAERLINTVARVTALVVLWLTGTLTVRSAVLVSVLTPLVAALPYLRLLRHPPTDPAEPAMPDPLVRSLLSFGSKIWLGSVASMLLSRASQVLMAPLSSVADLGLYTVASTVSDLPLIVALAVQGALFGVNAKEGDAGRVTETSRLTLLAGAGGCTLIAVTLSWWIGPLFGSEFEAATLPTVMLLASAVLCIPGLMAASALAACGRPGLRSLGLLLTLVVNVVCFVVLVPPFGVFGAAWTSIVSNVVMTSFMVVVSARVIGVPAASFVSISGSDLARARAELRGLARRLRRRSPAG